MTEGRLGEAAGSGTKHQLSRLPSSTAPLSEQAATGGGRHSDTPGEKLVRGILAAKGQCPVENCRGNRVLGKLAAPGLERQMLNRPVRERSLQQALPSSEPRCRTVAA